MKIVIAEHVTSSLQKLVKENCPDWIVHDSSPKDKKELIERLNGAVAASSYSIKYDAEIFRACPKLKFLAIPAVGANFFVNMEDAKTHGVTVMNCPGYNSEAVAEMAIGSAIAVSRKVPLLQKDLRSGVWDESSRGQSLLLSGKKIGIIGHGNVGKNIASKLSTWNVEIEFVDSSTNSDEIDRIIRESDSIFVCCPLNEDTKNLINKKRINSMKSTAVVVNVGRGAVIDEDALYRALKDKKIHGAGIDVFNDEPEYGESLPESIARFIALDNVYATPHLAGSSLESSHTLGLMIYENLKSVSSGSPINVYS